jgi:hypothetical protein
VVTAIIVGLLVLGVVGLLAVTFLDSPWEDELARKRADRARIQRAQLEAQQRLHALTSEAFTRLLDAARDHQQRQR